MTEKKEGSHYGSLLAYLVIGLLRNFLDIHFSPSEIVKLTIAPTHANRAVFTRSSEWIFATIVSKVPPAVPAAVPPWLLSAAIDPYFEVSYFMGSLTPPPLPPPPPQDADCILPSLSPFTAT